MQGGHPGVPPVAAPTSGPPQRQAAAAPAVPPAGPVPSSPVGPHWPIDARLLSTLPGPRHRLDPGFNQTEGPHGGTIPVAGWASVPQWMQTISEVFARSKLAKSHRSKRGIAKIVMIMGIPMLMLGIGVLIILIGLVLWLWARRKGRWDVEERKLEALTGILFALAPELRPNRPVGVHLDTTVHTRHPVAGAKGSYEQRWLWLQLPLLDGSQMTVEVTLRAKHKVKRKRYTKTKARFTERVVVRVVPPRGQSLPPHDVARLRGRMIASLRLHGASATPRRAAFTWTTQPCQHKGFGEHWYAESDTLIDSRQLTAAAIASFKLGRRTPREVPLR